MLHMQSWFDIESVDANVYDVMTVEYTTKSGKTGEPFVWHSLGALNPISNPAGEDSQDNTNDGFLTPPSWDEILVNLQPAIEEAGAGSAALEHVRLRFAFDTFDQLYNGFRGWNIDNLHVATPFDAPPPAITGVQTCVGNNLNPVTSIHGTNFLLNSKVSVDGGEPEEAQVPSSALIEIPVISAGTHTLQVIAAGGAGNSNVFTVTQPTTCEPPAPTPTPPPVIVTPPPPPTSPPITKKSPLVLEETGEIEWEVEFPEEGEVEYEGEILSGAELARVHRPGLLSLLDPVALPAWSQQGALAAKHKKHKKPKKCKKGFVKRHKKCVSAAPVHYAKGKLAIPKAGIYKLHIKPSAQVMRALRKGKRLNVRLRLVFTPAHTTVHILETASVKLHLKKKHKKKHRKGKHKKKKKKKKK
jgi:hypothetical protein